MGLWNVVKFSAKASIAGGSLYTSCLYDVWGSPAKTIQGFERFRKDLAETKTTLLTGLNLELPPLPEVDFPVKLALPEGVHKALQCDRSMGLKWNDVVLASSGFLADLPATSGQYIGTATEYVKQQLGDMASPQGVHDHVKGSDPKSEGG